MPKNRDQNITAETPDANKQLRDEINNLRSELADKEHALQIEAALEKVRTVAMGMNKPEDMLDICKMISMQLTSLGIDNIRNVQTAIFNVDRSTYFNYEYYAKHDKQIFTETNYQNNELHNAFAEEMLKGAGKVFIRTIPKSELEDWIAYQKTTNVFIDSFLESAPSLTYHWYSLGEIALGISTYEPLTEKELNVFKRFKNVFELAYTRFLDIKKAIVQAREAQIEAALERVRSKTMAMHNSEDVGSTVVTLFDELTKLGIKPFRCGIGIMQNDLKMEVWTVRTDENAKNILVIGQMDMSKHPLLHGAYNGWVNKEILFAYELEGDEVLNYFNVINNEQTAYPVKYDIASLPTKIFHHDFYFNEGTLFIFSLEQLSQETENILKRFASVFGQTYRRYLDLQKAEAQAKSAELERQRSESLLLNILPLEIANELKQFGKSYARKHEQVTILFTDIKGFSIISETLSPEELVNQLDECFRAFDHLVEKHGLEKIKTIGDAYVCACGLPNPDPDNAVKTVRAAIDMLAFTKGFGMTKKIQDLPVFDFRFGIHTGPVVTGVVGSKKFTYDIWGDAVNMAARMEQHGEAGKINISGATYQIVKDKFTCTHRGKIEAKNKGMVDMYFVET